MQESGSFWTDIKNLESQLEASPDSLCFARLSEIYLKVGLIDDALHVARLGSKKHPRYLSGQRALSLACHAKGLNDEALAALRIVTEALPEEVASQKLLGRLYAEAGNPEAAGQAFRIALEFAPDDVECRIELESLTRLMGDDEEIIEDLEMIEEGELVENVFAADESAFESAPSVQETTAASHHDPLSTGTLAELYVSQGFVDKALDIYRAILADNPSDHATAKRVVELEALETGLVEISEPVVSEIDEPEADMEPDVGMPIEALFQQPEPVVSVEPVMSMEPAMSTEPEFLSDADTTMAFVDDSMFEPVDIPVPPNGVADNALATLDGWLENIRRIKACR